MPESPLLAVQGVSVDYGGLRAVHGLDLTLAQGECLVMLGANGAGKTSLLHAIAGLVPIAEGTILYLGRAIQREKADGRVAAGIALVPEGRRVLRELTVHENLVLSRSAGRTKEFDRELDRVYEMFPVLAKRRGNRAVTLSGGEQEMLAIGRALLLGPQLLLVDEPSNGLAPIVVRQVYELLDAVRRDGMSILLAEQNTAALALATRVCVLSLGRVVTTGAPTDPSVKEAIAAAYLAVGTRHRRH